MLPRRCGLGTAIVWPGDVYTRSCRAFARLLADIPPDGVALDTWLSRWVAIDQYLSFTIYDDTFRALITSPRVATQRELLTRDDTDAALASRCRI